MPDSNFCNRDPCRAALDRAGPPRPRPALESGLSRQAPNLCYSETGHIKKASPTGRTPLWSALHTPMWSAPHTPPVERAPYPPLWSAHLKTGPIRPNTREMRGTVIWPVEKMRAPYPPWGREGGPNAFLQSRPLPRRARLRRPAQAQAGARKWTEPTGSKPML